MTPTLVLPLADIQTWLTPLWVLSLGVTAAALFLFVVYWICVVAWPAGARQARQAIDDGVLTPIGYVLATLVVLCLGTGLLSGLSLLIPGLSGPAMPWGEAWSSFSRLSTVGDHPTASFTIEAGAEDQELEVDFYADELLSYSFLSNAELRLSTETGRAYLNPEFKLQADKKYEWNPSAKFPRLFQERITKLYATNPGDEPASLKFDYSTDVIMQQVHHLPIAFVSVVALVMLYFLIAGLFPGVSTVSIGTAKEAISQPLFTLLIALGAALLVLYIVVPYNTFGEDVKLFTDSGLTTIMVLGILFALWTASTGISDEIEGKTALTMLSKPVSRRQFIIGKFLGILWPLLVMFFILGLVLLVTISIKVIYDARESSSPVPDWQLCYDTMITAVPGLVLAFLQATTLASISVAISTRFPMLPNLVIVGSIYVIGNLLPQIVASSAGDIPFVSFTAQLLALVIPMLNHFNIQPAISAGQPVPYEYLWMALLYCALYSSAAMLLALLGFEDRDLA